MIKDLFDQNYIVLDGAMGTMLQKSGEMGDVLPEVLNIEKPELITSIHKAYIDAGANVVYANTFGANRYKMKDATRPFRIGKGNTLMWIMGGVGFCGSLLAFILSFIPPGQIETGSSSVWYSVLIIGCIVMVVIPFIIYAMRKPSWRDPASDFAPFSTDRK